MFLAIIYTFPRGDSWSARREGFPESDRKRRVCVWAWASPPSLSPSDDTGLFICISCTSQVQRGVTHSCLTVKASQSGLAWCSLLMQPPSTPLSSSRVINGAQLEDLLAAAPVDAYFPPLESQIAEGICLESLLSEVKGCFSVAARGNLWLFVPQLPSVCNGEGSAGVLLHPPPSAQPLFSLISPNDDLCSIRTACKMMMCTYICIKASRCGRAPCFVMLLIEVRLICLLKQVRFGETFKIMSSKRHLYLCYY